MQIQSSLLTSSAWIVLALFIAGAVGCGGGEQVVPVSGVVTLDDKPLPQTQVVFYVEGAGPELNYTAITDAQGHFELQNVKTREPGLRPGMYQVTLSTGFAGPDTLETDPIPKELIPAKAQQQQFEVPADSEVEANFDVRSKG
ncbi:MAG: carboxypeptidase regulatory-like domain-containing protein [Planctomycetales bacterium]|nr:carboxypeptidase regulatory-like domain-containing protein [Planctomycetales bacterium]